ncbi:DUF3152 domain-containing protein [Streptomyces sp. NPDC001546]|uniref:DUF3152 domain-containing protein n=1 Tax=Streptomyces sp. NPDC001546 TaxID=3364585 RepID=UPI00367A69FF
MGRHSRKAPAPAPGEGLYEPRPHDSGAYGPGPYEPQPPAQARAPQPQPPAGYGEPAGPRRAAEPAVVHQGHAPPPARPAGHPEHREEDGARGADPAAASVYGDWRGTPRPAAPQPPEPLTSTGSHRRVPVPEALTSTGSPSRVPEPEPLTSTGSHRRVPAPEALTSTGSPSRVPEPEPLTSTGSHRRVPAPRVPDGAGAGRSPDRRRARIRTCTGIAALAVTAVLAVVVAGQVTTEGDPAAAGTPAAGDDVSQRPGDDKAAVSRSDGRPTPASPAQPPTYEQQMAQQLPIDAKLTGPGVFDTVPGTAKAPGKGKVVHYRVDVEQGLGMDAQLFAEAVQRTLNDPRSWGHGGEMTFERVADGKADFVITLASPGTTGAWCAKSDLDTTIDNVSCDSASTERVMINAFRWGQGSVTYGAGQMLAYRQMLINHEVGHRLGHGHVSCQKPGSLAPIMQQQTKSLDIDNIHCLPNPWVFPDN